MSESDSDSDGDADGARFRARPDMTALLRTLSERVGGLPACRPARAAGQLVRGERAGCFLLQVYAAVNDEHAFHRALCLFGHPRGLAGPGFVADRLRCRLPRENPFSPTSHRSSTNGLSRSRPSRRAQQQRGTRVGRADGRARGGGRWRAAAPPRAEPRRRQARTFRAQLVVSAEVEKTSGPATRRPRLSQVRSGRRRRRGAGTDAADASELAGIATSFGADRPSAEQLSWAHFTARVACAPSVLLLLRQRGRSSRRVHSARPRACPVRALRPARRFEFQVLPQVPLHGDRLVAEAPG